MTVCYADLHFSCFRTVCIVINFTFLNGNITHINRVIVCPGLAKTVPDFGGWSRPVVENYHGRPTNAGARDAVCLGVGAVQSTL